MNDDLKKIDSVYPANIPTEIASTSGAARSFPFEKYNKLSEGSINKHTLALVIAGGVLLVWTFSGSEYGAIILLTAIFTRLFFIIKNNIMGPFGRRTNLIIIQKRARIYAIIGLCILIALLVLSLSNTGGESELENSNIVLLAVALPVGLILGYWHSYINLERMRLNFRRYGAKVI